MSIVFEMSARIRARYAPMNITHIPGFPNKIPNVDWLMYLPSFKDEDCLMKMFMAYLEDNSRLWYEGLPVSSICSLKYFHIIFFNNYKQRHPILLLIESFLWKIWGSFSNHGY